MKLGIVIQARLGSTRLPKKVLLPLGNKTIISAIVDKLKALSLPIVVATTRSPTDDNLIAYLNQNGIKGFRGSEHNVLERFIEAAEVHDFDYAIRVCADNPYIDLGYLKELIKCSQKNVPLDYGSFGYKNKPTVLSHFGIFAEMVSVSALKKLNRQFSENKTFLEHVTFGIYTNPSLFKVKIWDLTEELQKYEHIRLTVDTAADYENVLAIFNNLPSKDLPTLKDISRIIEKQKPIADAMKLAIRQNKK